MYTSRRAESRSRVSSLFHLPPRRVAVARFVSRVSCRAHAFPRSPHIDESVTLGSAFRAPKIFAMDATLLTIARWKTATRGTSACKVLQLDARGKTVGEALETLRNSGHESLPTTCAETSETTSMVSVRSFFDLFVRELRSDLERPHEPGVSDAPRASGRDETDVAETLGVVVETSEDEREGATRETSETRLSTFEKMLSLPASALMPLCRQIEKKSPDTKWSECVESFRADGVVFFDADDLDETTRRVVTAEDVVFFLGVEHVLHRAFDPACYDENILFDSCKSTYIVVRVEHACTTAANCFAWLFERGADACVFVESACRVPGANSNAGASSHGVVVSELSIRDVIDLTPESFQRIFATSPIDFARAKPTKTGACARAFVGSHDGGVDGARETIDAFTRKKPERLPRRFYLYIDGRLRAFTPLTALETLLAADAANR